MQNSSFFVLFGAICLLGYLFYIQPPLNKAPAVDQLAAQTNAVVQPAAPQTAQDYQQATVTAEPSPMAAPPQGPDKKRHSIDELTAPPQ